MRQDFAQSTSFSSAFCDPAIIPAAKGLLAYLIAKGGGRPVSVSRGEIAEEFGACNRAIDRYVRQLEAAGYLRVLRTYDGAGLSKNSYTPVFEGGERYVAVAM